MQGTVSGLRDFRATVMRLGYGSSVVNMMCR